MTVPSPEQVGHGATLTNWPKNERCARRTSPDPLHVVQRCGFRARLRARAFAPIARVEQLRVERLLHAGRDFLQRQLDGELDVASGAAVPLPTSAARPNRSPESAEGAEVAHEDAERFGEIDVMESTAAGGAAQSRLHRSDRTRRAC